MNSVNNKFDLLLRFVEVVKEQSSWLIEDLCSLLNINNDEFDYIVSTLSQIYISNDFDLFLDIEISDKKIDVELNDVVSDTQFITDYELLSMYKFLIDSDINYLESFVPLKHLLSFKDILSKHIAIKDENSSYLNDDEERVLESQELIIDYSPLGSVSSFNYHIKPLSLLKKNEGIALLALDVKANKPKTFLIHRIQNTTKDIFDFETVSTSLNDEEYILKFKYLDKNILISGIDSSSIVKNKSGSYNIKFRNRDIAIEFYKKNIYKLKVLDDIGIDNEIKSSFNKVINLVNK